MRKTYVEFKRARENANSAANLEQRAKAGLKHVAEILGIMQVRRMGQPACEGERVAFNDPVRQKCSSGDDLGESGPG